jgi:hypothetical protein
MKKGLVMVGAVLVALVGGWALAGFIAQLPGNMPDFLDDFIRWSLKATGALQLSNTDDIETIAFLLVFSMCAVLVGVLEASCWAVVRRVRLR